MNVVPLGKFIIIISLKYIYIYFFFIFRIFNKDVLLQKDNKIKNININSTYIAETDLKINLNITENLKESVESTKQPYSKNLRKSLNRNDTTKVKIMPEEFQHKDQKTNLTYQVEDKLLKKTNSSKELTICKIDLNESENLDDVIIKNAEDMDEDKTYLHCKVFLDNKNENKIIENFDESKIDEKHPFRELGEEEIDLITTHHYDYIDESEDIVKNEEAYRNKDSSEYFHKKIVNPIDNHVLKNTKKKNVTYIPQLDNLETEILFQEKTIEMENKNEPGKIGMNPSEQNNPVYLKDPYTMDSSEYAVANSQPIFIELQMKKKNDNEIYINENSNEFTESKSIESTLFGYDDEYYTKHGLDRYSRRAKWQHIDTSTIPETRVLNYEPIVEHTHADIENKIQKKYEQHGKYETPVQNYVTIPINYLSKVSNFIPMKIMSNF